MGIGAGAIDTAAVQLKEASEKTAVQQLKEASRRTFEQAQGCLSPRAGRGGDASDRVEANKYRALADAERLRADRNEGELFLLRARLDGMREQQLSELVRRGQSGRLGGATAGHRGLIRLHLTAWGCPPHSGGESQPLRSHREAVALQPEAFES